MIRWTRVGRFRACRFSVVAALAAGLTLVVWFSFGFLAGETPSLARLATGNVAVGAAEDPISDLLSGWDVRPLEGRLSGQRAYAPYEGPEGASRSLLRSLSGVSKIARGEPDDALHAVVRAKCLLIQRRARESIEILHSVRPDLGSDASYWNDLSVAFLALPPDATEPAPLIRALGAVQRALALDAGHAEARFNRALILEGLGLGGRQGREAWLAAAEVLPIGDGWRREAEERAAATDEPRLAWERALAEAEAELTATEPLLRLVPAHPTAARQWIEKGLLPTWAERWRAGDRRHARLVLSLATAVARAEAWVDPMDEAVITAIEAAGDDPARLAEGHALYGAATEAYEANDFAEADHLFHQARERLEVARSPFRYWADIQIAVCAYQQFGRRETVRRLRQLLSEVDGKGYLGLEGRALYLLGLTHHIEGRPAEAIEALESSLAAFVSMGDPEAAATVHAVLAEAEQTVGRTDRMWAHHLESLRGLPYVRESRRRNMILGEAAIGAADYGEPDSGRALAAWRLAELDGTSNPMEWAITYRTLALVELSAGNPGAAMDHLERQGRVLETMESNDVVRALWGDYRALQGWLLRDGDPDSAVRALSEAIESYVDTSFLQRLAQLYHQRATLHLDRGNVAAAERDLLAAAEARERERTELDRGDEASLRFGHFARTRTIYQDLAALQMSQGRVAEAFETSERGRARELLDRLERIAGSTMPRNLLGASEATIRAALPPESTLLSYQVSDEATLVWAVGHGGVRGAVLDGGRSAWAELGSERDSAPAPGWARRLLGSMASSIGCPRRIIVVPDGPLWDAPFEAVAEELCSGADSPVDLSFAPSASVLVVGRTGRRGDVSRPALVVGDPAPAPMDRHLPRLPGAREEAGRAAARLGVEPLVGRAATRERFLESAPGSRVIYIAAHAEINPTDPWLSSLVLAPSGGGASGRIYAHQILDLDLSATDTVVLSACRTAAGEAAPGEGVSALVHAFLAAGAGEVVASRRPVDDRGVPEMRRYLGRFGKGEAVVRRFE